MTGDEQPSMPQPARERQILEIVIWVFSPLLLIVAAAVIAFVLGAPWLRASLVFALLATGAGGYLLYRPHSWAPFGRVRAASLIYSGIGALVLALALSSGESQPGQATSRVPDVQADVQGAAAPVRWPPPERRSLYPWAYTVSPLTLSCLNSTAPGAGEVIATTDDGRVFAISESAVSEERPNIQSLQRTSGPQEEVREGVASLARAGQRMCQGPDGPSLTLVASAGDPPPPPPSPWSYSSTVDEMSDQRTSHACTMSTNAVQLGWPYETQLVSLCLRQHPRWGQDVILRLVRGGQFLCTSYEACTVRIRFGDGEAAAYSALEPSDNSSDTIFISNDARFIGNLRRSSRVIIEANFYQAGAQRMSFDTGQLEWPPRS